MIAQALRLNDFHLREHLLVVDCPVCAGMDAPVTIRAKCDHEARIVRSSIRQPSDVVRLQVWNPVRSQKRRLAPATFADPCASPDNVFLYVFTALDDRPHALSGGRSRICSSKRPVLKRLQIRKGCRRSGVNRFGKRLKRSEFEHDGIALRAAAVSSPLNAIALEYEFPFEAQTGSRLAEQKQISTVLSVVADLPVAANELHVAALALAVIIEHAIIAEFVGIAVGKALFASNDNNQSVSAGRDDASLHLPAETRMNVGAPIVDAPSLESPAHGAPSNLGRVSAHVGRQVEVSQQGVVSNFPTFAGTGGGRPSQALSNLAFSEEANS